MKSSATSPTSRIALDDVDADFFLNEARTADLLAVNPRTMAQWRLRGVGPKYVRISPRCVRYRYRDVIAWAECKVHASTSEY